MILFPLHTLSRVIMPPLLRRFAFDIRYVSDADDAVTR